MNTQVAESPVKGRMSENFESKGVRERQRGIHSISPFNVYVHTRTYDIAKMYVCSHAGSENIPKKVISFQIREGVCDSGWK